jgi:hypothetical protein|tara:strand:+ start:168 stop:314 length:147 start_codon:yes stop_codon:yes gene_type:complete
MGNICGAPRGSKDDIGEQQNIDSKVRGKKGAVSTHTIKFKRLEGCYGK